jgi:hypothetical protein
MKKTLIFLITLGLIVYSCAQNQSPDFDHYGVYLQNGNEYIELNEGAEVNMPEVSVDGDVVLFVYSPTAKNQKYSFGQGQGAKIEHTVAPVEGKDEMVKITSEVFGGKIYFGIRGANEGNYHFMAENKNIKQSLKKWMKNVIDYYEQGNFAGIFDLTTPQYRRSRMSATQVEKTIKQMKSDPRMLQGLINQIHADIKKLDDKDGVILKPATSEICIGANCYHHWGGGKWG